jgi:hypothetical protein
MVAAIFDAKLGGYQDPLDEYGLTIPVDLDTLIERVYVAPSTPTWVVKMLEQIMTLSKLTVSLNRTSLDQDPVY